VIHPDGGPCPPSGNDGTNAHFVLMFDDFPVKFSGDSLLTIGKREKMELLDPPSTTVVAAV
jgi:hypothetical protein